MSIGADLNWGSRVQQIPEFILMRAMAELSRDIYNFSVRFVLKVTVISMNLSCLTLWEV